MEKIVQLTPEVKELEKEAQVPTTSSKPTQELSGYPVLGDDSIMMEKEHGTCKRPVQ